MLFKLSKDVSELHWSTHVGGGGDDVGTSVLATEETIYVTGYTNSSHFLGGGIISYEEIDPSGSVRGRGMPTDAFVAAFPRADLKAGSFSDAVTVRFLGGSLGDRAYFSDTDGDGSIYVAGQTQGGYPVHNTEDRFHQPGKYHFIHKLSPDLTTDTWAITFGGRSKPQLTLTAFQVDYCGRIYLVGWGGFYNGWSGSIGSDVTGLPVTDDALQVGLNAGFYTLVLDKDAEGGVPFYAGYFPSTDEAGVHTDGGASLYDKRGVVYQAVCVCRDGYVTTSGAFASDSPDSGAASCVMGGFKLDFETGAGPFFTANTLAGDRPDAKRACAPETLVFTSPDEVLPDDKWEVEDGGEVIHTVFGVNTLHFTFNKAGTYTIRLTKQEEVCDESQDFSRTVEVQPRPSYKLEGDSVLCGAGSITSLRVEHVGASPLPSTYAWEPVTHVAGSATQAEMTSAPLPLDETAYQVTITEGVCVTVEEAVVKVLPEPTVFIRGDRAIFADLRGRRSRGAVELCRQCEFFLLGYGRRDAPHEISG